MNQAAITLLTIFAVVSTLSAFQPTTRIHGNNRHANDSYFRRDPTTKIGVVGFWDALPFAPKYNKRTKTNDKKAKQEIAQATEELEESLDDAKASIDAANLALQDADSVLSQQQQQPENDDDSSENDWSSMTVPMLKQALKDRGLKVSGKKVELVDRLESKESEKLDGTTDDHDDDDAEDVSIVAEEVEEAEEAAEEVEEIEEAVEAEETVATMESDDNDDDSSDEWEWTEVDELSDVDYSSMTVSQLKEELRTLDLAVGGKKVDLIARLASYHAATASTEEEEPELEEPELQEPEPVAAVANDDSGDDDASSASSLDVDYTEYTVAQLKVELRNNGLKVSGKKAELIERLQKA